MFYEYFCFIFFFRCMTDELTATAVMMTEPSDKILKKRSQPSSIISCALLNAASWTGEVERRAACKEALIVSRSSQKTCEVG
jgi:hypothetical protein